MLYVIHCSDPIDPTCSDNAFAGEAEAARQAGLISLLIDHDALLAGDMRQALRRVRASEPGPAVYRGWMMRAEAYARLHAALTARGIAMLTNPDAYATCHHLPEAYHYVGRWMPQTAWIGLYDMDDPQALEAAFASLGNSAITVKDWVKSQAAGYWSEACFIPDASDRRAASDVIRRFRELQGTDLVGGLVFRRFVELEKLGDEPIEWRAFCLAGKVIGCWPRFSGYASAPPPKDLLASVAQALSSPFFTADFALGRDGRWWLMETGDGQVSGFPNGAAEIVMGALVRELDQIAPV